MRLKYKARYLKYKPNCWQIRGLAASINSPCVRRGRLGECTIKLGYALFLTTIVFRRVGNV